MCVRPLVVLSVYPRVAAQTPRQWQAGVGRCRPHGKAQGSLRALSSLGALTSSTNGGTKAEGAGMQEA